MGSERVELSGIAEERGLVDRHRDHEGFRDFRVGRQPLDVLIRRQAEPLRLGPDAPGEPVPERAGGSHPDGAAEVGGCRLERGHLRSLVWRWARMAGAIWPSGSDRSTAPDVIATLGMP